MKNPLKILVVACLLTSCDSMLGKEVGRLPINELSSDGNLIVKETTLDLRKDDEIAIWSDMDIEYEGDVALQFRVEVWKDSSKLHAFEIDPTKKNITIGEVKTSVMDETDWRFSGKNAEFKAEEDGQYTFKGILVASQNSSLKINKAEIFFRK